MPDTQPKAARTAETRSQPWAVRGVSKEARTKAAGAAQIAGMPLGKWLDRTIIDAANGQISSRKEVGPTVEQMVAQLRDLVRESMEKQEQTAREVADLKDQLVTPRLSVLHRLFTMGRR